MKKIFRGRNLEACLAKAEKDLNIKKEDIVYKIIKEEKGVFSKRRCEIEVDIKDEKISSVKEVQNSSQLEESNQLEDNNKLEESNQLENNNKSEEIKIHDNKIILAEEDSGEYEIYFDPEIEVKVNGIRISNGQKVTNKDEIIYSCEEIKARRSIKIEVSPLSAKATTSFESSSVAKLTCRKINNNIRIKKRMVNGTMAPFYTKDEIKVLLLEKKVIYGHDEEAIDKICTEYNISNIEIAKGTPVVNDENDEIKIFFKSGQKNFKEDTDERIDYKNLYSIASVSSGEKIAELIVGKSGNDGMDIFGKPSIRKIKKPIQLRTGQGCKIEDNSVFSIIDGQPSVKNGMFHVHKVLQNPGDVDLKSGNIKFVGDVKINGAVKNGMTVEAGNSLEIIGSVEEATVIAQGETRILGSLINSKVTVGAKDLLKQNYIDALTEFKNDMENLVTAVMDVKARSHLSEGMSDGQIVKLLIETKFKTLQKKSFRILNGLEGEYSNQIRGFIRNKLIGMGPLKIKFTSELHEFLLWLEKEREPFKEEVFIPVDIHMSYSQDSSIESTGTIYINGKGEYISKITARGDIIFTQNRAVARGGELKAGKKIAVKTVGSSAGVTTTLRVPKNGQITADVAYQNTEFFFGEMKYILETPSKDINAFLDHKGEIIVEKFVL